MVKECGMGEWVSGDWIKVSEWIFIRFSTMLRDCDVMVRMM